MADHAAHTLAALRKAEADVLKRLKCLGYVIIPDEPTTGMIKAMARGICLHRVMPACNCAGSGVCRAKTENLIGDGALHGQTARAAYAALVAHVKEGT